MARRIIVVDSQRLNMIQNCMFKYKMTFGRNLDPVIKPDYFERGDLLHKMLEVYYNMKRYRTRWQQNGFTHKKVVESCVRAGRHFGVHMQLQVEDVEDVIRTFVEYCEFRENDGWDQIQAIEQVGSKLLYEDEDLVILYEFKIDLIISLQNYPILPIDHKSSKQRKRTNNLSNQFMGYAWGMGVNNVLVNKIGFQKTLKPNEKFEQHLLSYTNDNLQEWVDNSVFWIKYAIQMIDNDHYPRNFTSCDKYAGCIFQEICESDPVVRERKIREQFDTRDTWDVGSNL